MAYNNLTTEQMFTITNLKEIYESNNRLLTSVTQITNTNFNNTTITSLVNNLISSNNDIKHNIIGLLNLNTNNRQHNNNNNNSRQSNHRQHNYNIRPTYHSNRQSYLNNPTISNLFNTFFDPIEIFPTPSQIESATRVVRFGDIISPINSACPISLENFNNNDRVLIIRYCNHIFSNTELISWFMTNCRCPVCRYDIRNYISTNTNNISGNVDLSSNILPSPLNSIERNSTTDSNQLVDLLFSNLLDNHNISDISGNNLSSNNLSSNNLSSNISVPRSNYVNNNSISDTYVTDISGNNLLRLFFTS
jgi:hypothetical protein